MNKGFVVTKIAILNFLAFGNLIKIRFGFSKVFFPLLFVHCYKEISVDVPFHMHIGLSMMIGNPEQFKGYLVPKNDFSPC